MKLEIRAWDSISEADEVYEKKLDNDKIAEKWVTRPKSGLHVRKKNKICQVVFDASIEVSGRQQVFITFSEREIFQLARMCRRERTDEAFLQAIDVAGETKQKTKRS